MLRRLILEHLLNFIMHMHPRRPTHALIEKTQTSFWYKQSGASSVAQTVYSGCITKQSCVSEHWKYLNYVLFIKLHSYQFYKFSMDT